MTKEDEQLVALLMINGDKSFANAYGLCRFIARKFEVFDCSGLIKTLTDNHYVTSIDEGGVKFFTLTLIGKGFLDENRTRIVSFLKKEFPNEVSIIEHLEGVS